MSAIVAEPFGTQRLYLEPLKVEHADMLVKVLSDSSLHKYIGGRPDTLEELRARYQRVLAGAPDPGVSWCNWMACWRETGEPIGTLQATITQNENGLDGEIAGVVGTPWQNKGIAREMARALIKWFARQGIRRVVAHVHPDHGASSAVVAVLGLQPTPVHVDGEVEWELLLQAR